MLPRFTETELSRKSYRAHSSGHFNGSVWVQGPVLVDVVVTQLLSFDPTYSVLIDGRRQFGGFARHLGSEYPGGFLSGWGELRPECGGFEGDYMVCEACGEHISEHASAVRAEFSRDRYGSVGTGETGTASLSLLFPWAVVVVVLLMLAVPVGRAVGGMRAAAAVSCFEDGSCDDGSCWSSVCAADIWAR